MRRGADAARSALRRDQCCSASASYDVGTSTRVHRGREDREAAASLTRKQLAIYLMAGSETPDLAAAAVAGGADVVELGFPFSDPLADGPVIRRAAERALASGHADGRVPGLPAARRGLASTFRSSR